MTTVIWVGAITTSITSDGSGHGCSTRTQLELKFDLNQFGWVGSTPRVAPSKLLNKIFFGIIVLDLLWVFKR